MLRIRPPVERHQDRLRNLMHLISTVATAASIAKTRRLRDHAPEPVAPVRAGPRCEQAVAQHAFPLR